MTERIKAWQCVGCGRIEGPQQCIGICRDRKVELVDAADHDAVLTELEAERRRADALAALVRQFAHTTPRAGEWERAWLALQQRARRMMAGPASGTSIGTRNSHRLTWINNAAAEPPRLKRRR